MPPLYQITEGGEVNGVHTHHVMRQKDAGKLQTLLQIWEERGKGNQGETALLDSPHFD